MKTNLTQDNIVTCNNKVSPRKYVYFFYCRSYSKCIQIFWDSLYLNHKGTFQTSNAPMHGDVENSYIVEKLFESPLGKLYTKEKGSSSNNI